MLRRNRITPLQAVLRGLLSGAAGIAAMDTLEYYRYRREGGTSRLLEYEFGGESAWDKVSAPGKVGKRIVEGMTRRELPASTPARRTTSCIGATACYGAAFMGSLPARYTGRARCSVSPSRSWSGLPATCSFRPPGSTDRYGTTTLKPCSRT